MLEWLLKMYNCISGKKGFKRCFPVCYAELRTLRVPI